MHCTNCSAEIQNNFKFCASCGKPVPASACPNCGSPVKPDASFCTNCGASLAPANHPAASPPPPPPSAASGIASDLRDLAPGEVVLMDSGRFPISYIKNLMTSINGKLYLTSTRIVFRAVALQGVGGVSTGGIFVPNPKDTNKARTYFSIPLSQVVSVKNGWATLTIQAGENFKFGGMRKTNEWADAINRAKGRG